MADLSKGIEFLSKKFITTTKISSKEKDTLRTRFRKTGRWKWDRSKISETWRRRCLKSISQRQSPTFQQSNQRNTSASTPISTSRKMPFHSHIPISTSSLTLITILSSFTNLSPFYNSRACCTSSKKLTPSECFNSSQKTRTLE